MWERVLSCVHACLHLLLVSGRGGALAAAPCPARRQFGGHPGPKAAMRGPKEWPGDLPVAPHQHQAHSDARGFSEGWRSVWRPASPWAGRILSFCFSSWSKQCIIRKQNIKPSPSWCCNTQSNYREIWFFLCHFSLNWHQFNQNKENQMNWHNRKIQPTRSFKS